MSSIVWRFSADQVFSLCKRARSALIRRNALTTGDRRFGSNVRQRRRSPGRRQKQLRRPRHAGPVVASIARHRAESMTGRAAGRTGFAGPVRRPLAPRPAGRRRAIRSEDLRRAAAEANPPRRGNLVERRSLTRATRRGFKRQRPQSLQMSPSSTQGRFCAIIRLSAVETRTADGVHYVTEGHAKGCERSRVLVSRFARK